MTKLYCLIILVFVFMVCGGQNLVPNYSFEELNYCPFGCSSMTQIPHWELSDFSSDYFNLNCNDGNGPSGCIIRYRIPGKKFKTGKACAGIGYSCEAIECKLTSPLIKDSLYAVSFYVILGDSSKYTTDEIGMYLSDKQVRPGPNYDPYKSVYTLTPQILNKPGNYIKKTEWMRIDGVYKATGNEQYLVISGFKKMWDVKPTGDNCQLYCYLYIDDVCVVPLNEKRSENSYGY